MTSGQLYLTHAIHGHVPLKAAPGTILRRTISHEDVGLQKAVVFDIFSSITTIQLQPSH